MGKPKGFSRRPQKQSGVAVLIRRRTADQSRVSDVHVQSRTAGNAGQPGVEAVYEKDANTWRGAGHAKAVPDPGHPRRRMNRHELLSRPPELVAAHVHHIATADPGVRHAGVIHSAQSAIQIKLGNGLPTVSRLSPESMHGEPERRR